MKAPAPPGTTRTRSKSAAQVPRRIPVARRSGDAIGRTQSSGVLAGKVGRSPGGGTAAQRTLASLVELYCAAGKPERSAAYPARVRAPPADRTAAPNGLLRREASSLGRARARHLHDASRLHLVEVGVHRDRPGHERVVAD